MPGDRYVCAACGRPSGDPLCCPSADPLPLDGAALPGLVGAELPSADDMLAGPDITQKAERLAADYDRWAGLMEAIPWVDVQLGPTVVGGFRRTAAVLRVLCKRLARMSAAHDAEVLRLTAEVEALRAERDRLRLSGQGNANIVGQLRAYVRSVEEWGRERIEGGPEERAKSKAMEAVWNGVLRTLAAYDRAREAGARTGEGKDG